MTQITMMDVGLILKEWKYDEDSGSMMCRCPECGGRLAISIYQYWNPYRFCPYCGVKLSEGKFVRRKCQIYGRDQEAERKVRKEFGHEG